MNDALKEEMRRILENLGYDAESADDSLTRDALLRIVSIVKDKLEEE